MKLRALLIIIVFVLAATRAFCYPAGVTVLNNQEYFPAAQKAISGAKKSIFAVMYLINFNREDKNSKVTQLMDELAKAKLRGVEVKVILDYQSSSDFLAEQSNYAAFRFLKDKGIDAYFDGAVVYTHTKALVIDEKTVISGSHNWSEAALTRNNEVSFLIDSPKLASQLLEEFSRIKLSSAKLEEASGVKIPYWVMKKNGVMQEMVRRHHALALDIWLFFLKNFDGNSEGIVNTDYDALASSLASLRNRGRPYYRGGINWQLRKLDKLYKLIEAQTSINQPFKVKLSQKIGDETFSLPVFYWDYDWANRLDMNAKVCLLINLAELGSKQQAPEWSLSRPLIAEKYGISLKVLYSGMKALRDFNIINIKYSEIDKGYEFRAPSTIIFLGLYDMGKFERNLKRLEDAYGKELITKSREYASIVFKGYDLTVIEEIAKLTNLYGAANIDEAFKVVRKKSSDNPKRSFGYVTGILGKMKKFQ